MPGPQSLKIAPRESAVENVASHHFRKLLRHLLQEQECWQGCWQKKEVLAKKGGAGRRAGKGVVDLSFIIAMQLTPSTIQLLILIT